MQEILANAISHAVAMQAEMFKIFIEQFLPTLNAIVYMVAGVVIYRFGCKR